MRALFVSEGALGIGTVGHARVEPAIRAGLARRSDVQARYITLRPMNRVAHSLARGVPVLGWADVDLQAVRWHLVQALRTRRMVERELRRHPADVIHVVSHSIAICLGEIMRRVPTMLSVDAPMWPWREFAQWAPVRAHSRAMLSPSLALERRAFRRAALVLPWSDWARAGVEREAPDARCENHHPGIDLETFRPARQRPRERPRVLFVGGRFEPKGGHDLLDAVEIVGRERMDLDVVTFEHVPERPGLRVHRNVARDELLDLQQQADIAVMPTHSDTYPWAVLEAMSCGAAVLSTTVGGIPGMLDHGRAGTLTAPGDVPALAAALSGLLDDPARRDALGTAARRRVEACYDARRQTSRLVELMRTVAEQ